MQFVLRLSADGAEVEAYAARAADAADGRRLGEDEFAGGQSLGDGFHLVDKDIDLRIRCLALVPVVETDESTGHIFGSTPKRRSSAGVGDTLNAGNLKHLFVERIHDVDGLIVRLSFRKTAVDGNVTAILLGEKRLRNLAGSPPQERDHAAEKHRRQKTATHEDAHEEQIAASTGIDSRIERREDLERLFARRLEDVGAQNRRKYERDHRRKAERDTHRHGELHVHHADHAGIESERHVAGERHERGGDDRAGNLRHRLGRRLLGGKPFADHERLAVLHHHDRVVHERTDDENKPEHGQDVERVPERIKERERTEKRDGNRDRGH